MMIPVVALTLGCNREMDTEISLIEGEITLYATSGEQKTRTSLQQDGSIYWSPSDRISVFYGDKSGVFVSTNTVAAASAEFKGTLEDFTLDGTTEFVAVYPYSKENGYSGNTVSLNLPSIQMGEKRTFVEGLFPIVAKSRDYNLHFYNVCGGVKFTLNRGDIKKVVFRGNDGETLSGRLAVEFSSDGTPTVTGISDGIPSVSLIAPGGETLQARTPYYLVIVPQELTKGYTMELYSDELVETITTDTPVTVRRSVWGVLNNLGTDVDNKPEMVDLGLPSGIKWASYNVGASSPEGLGDYFAWGETEPYYSSLDPLTWKEGIEQGYAIWNYQWWSEGSGLTKYCTSPTYGHDGFTDGKTVLDPADDVAYLYFGDKWRMPLEGEMDELVHKCSWEWTSVNNVNGFTVTGRNGNSIFLPAAGYWQFTNFYYSASGGLYWSSSVYMGNQESAQSLNIFSVGGSYITFSIRANGLSVRPVYGDPAPVDEIRISVSKLDLLVNETSSLYATILPDYANKAVLWSSSNESIATVSPSGIVTGVGPGTAVITATTADGGKTATCNVTVWAPYSATVPEAVDMGLPSGIKWASFNLGATKPEGNGDYFAWGETTPYYFNFEPLVWKTGKGNGYTWGTYKWSLGDERSLSKYCTDPSYGYNGFTDGMTVLDARDDAAHVHLGDKWRIPTFEECEELFNSNYTTTEWTAEGGVYGCRVTSRSTGNSIFLPATGTWMETASVSVGSDGYYLSSSLRTDYPNTLDGLWFNSSDTGCFNNLRAFGYTVRPVYDEDYNPVQESGVIWENDGTHGEINWDATYYFTEDGKDTYGTALVTFSAAVWDIIKTETFYLLLRGSNPYIYVTTGWWDTTWTGTEIMPGNERLVDNGDGTWTLAIHFGDDPILKNIDEHGLLFTGERYTPLKLYY